MVFRKKKKKKKTTPHEIKSILKRKKMGDTPFSTVSFNRFNTANNDIEMGKFVEFNTLANPYGRIGGNSSSSYLAKPCSAVVGTNKVLCSVSWHDSGNERFGGYGIIDVIQNNNTSTYTSMPSSSFPPTRGSMYNIFKQSNTIINRVFQYSADINYSGTFYSPTNKKLSIFDINDDNSAIQVASSNINNDYYFKFTPSMDDNYILSVGDNSTQKYILSKIDYSTQTITDIDSTPFTILPGNTMRNIFVLSASLFVHSFTSRDLTDTSIYHPAFKVIDIKNDTITTYDDIVITEVNISNTSEIFYHRLSDDKFIILSPTVYTSTTLKDVGLNTFTYRITNGEIELISSKVLYYSSSESRMMLSGGNTYSYNQINDSIGIVCVASSDTPKGALTSFIFIGEDDSINISSPINAGGGNYGNSIDYINQFYLPSVNSIVTLGGYSKMSLAIDTQPLTIVKAKHGASSMMLLEDASDSIKGMVGLIYQ